MDNASTAEEWATANRDALQNQAWEQGSVVEGPIHRARCSIRHEEAFPMASSRATLRPSSEETASAVRYI